MFERATRAVADRRLDRTDRLLWAVAVAATVADAALTIFGVTHGATEGNPVMQIASRRSASWRACSR